MKNPFRAMARASRMMKKRRPLAAALIMQEMMLDAAKPVRKARAKPVARKTPAARPSIRPKAPVVARGAGRALPPSRPAPGSFIDGRFDSGEGVLNYKFYTPHGSPRRRMPLVVMLHGCTQFASDFAAGTAMNALADELGFLVLYPEQAVSANLARCWNWHSPENQKRGRGEPALIAALTRHALALGRGNPARVYIAGISAGGAASAIIATAYPDLYAAVGIHSGLARGNVRTLAGALRAMRGDRAPDTSARATRPPPMIVFHGDQDSVVHPSNAAGFLLQLQQSRPGPLARTVASGRSAGGRDYTRVVYRSRSDAVLLEDWTIHGSGHAWSGGSSAGLHTDPAGPSASREMLRFFLTHRQATTRSSA